MPRPAVFLPLTRPVWGVSSCLIAALFLAALCASAQPPASAPPAPAAASGPPPASPALDAALDAAESRHRTAYRAADYPAAIAAARDGLAIATASGSHRAQAPFLRHLAYDYWLMGDSALALDYAQRVLAAGDQLRDDELRAQGHRYLGLTYSIMGDHARARTQAETALQFAALTTNTNLQAFTRQDLALAQLKFGERAAARRTFEEVQAYWEKQDNRWNAHNTLANLADLAATDGDLPAAIALYEKIYATRVELDDRRGQVRALCALAGLQLSLGQPDLALSRLTAAAPLATAIGGHRLLAEFHSQLARVQEARRDFAAALAAERLAASAREQLAGERARVHAADLAERLDHARQQRAIDALVREKVIQHASLRTQEAELAHGRSLRFALLDGLLVVALVFATIVLIQRLRLRAERRILAATRAAKEDAERSDLAKTRFLAVASHEIRAPLGNVVNLLRGLRDELASDRQTSDHLELVAVETQRVLDLVEDLLTTAAIDGGQLKLRLAPFDLSDVVRTIVHTTNWQAEAKSLKIVFLDPAPGASVLLGDSARLHQVVANLVTNAIKFSPQGKTIALSLVREGQSVLFAVCDEGPGISADDAQRLFTPFERLSARPTGGETSHGLGLSIAYEIVRLHGGTIRVSSTPGAGAVFTVVLPVGELPA